MINKLTAEQIEFAKAAGFYWHPVQKCLCTRHSSGAWVAIDDMLARFVALLSARPAESWQVEIDAYKREVRELEAVLRIPEKMEDDWIRANVQRPIEAGIPPDDDVLAWNNDPGFAAIIEASFISQSFPEYTHWKKKPEAPADIDHAKGVVHDR